MPSLEFRRVRSEEHTSELQSHSHLVCRLLLEKKKSRSEEHTSELQSPLISYAVFCLKKKTMLLAALFPPFTPTAHANPAVPSDALCKLPASFLFFFFNDTATTEIYTLSLHDALPISPVTLSSRKQKTAYEMRV